MGVKFASFSGVTGTPPRVSPAVGSHDLTFIFEAAGSKPRLLSMSSLLLEEDLGLLGFCTLLDGLVLVVEGVVDAGVEAIKLKFLVASPPVALATVVAIERGSTANIVVAAEED